ncbi:septation ring formation regulator EzrA [Paenibacillus eucommiae]|uniref:Membrane protein YgcG n=1 Tax=Paenibacillus eucommiae TaxID=1355755 RepID=A0ABS4J7S2_9BACL|nr:septation ring formation regulator EzrA [Paenibacillus eucommiae]MBP1995902.1 putative membrane protein YgcG [Paenibacillus eucommiae]
MKKLAGLFILLSLLFGQIAYAAEIPNKKGIVTDLAGMFPKDQIQSLEKASVDKTYKFYILTVESLGGENSADYASSVYNSWKLQANDILLLISKNERRIEMNFKNSELQAQMDALGPDYDQDGSLDQSKLEEFVTKHFIPWAKKGDFVQASLTLVNETNRLIAPVPVPTGSKEVATATALPASSSPTAAIQQKSTVDIEQIGTYVTFVVLAAAALVLIMIGWSKKRRLASLRPSISSLLVETHRANEELRPFMGMTQGTTARMVQAIDEQLASLMVQVGALEKEFEETKVFLLHIGKLNQLYGKYKKHIDMLAASLAERRKDIEHIVETDKTVKRSIHELADNLQTLKAELNKAVTETSFPLTRIFEECAVIETELKESDDLDVFDPIEAEKLIHSAAEKCKQTSHALKLVPGYKNKYHTFPATAADFREQIADIIRLNHLTNVMERLNPFARIDKSREIAETMYVELQQGNLNLVIKWAEEIDRLLAKALAMTNRQASLRQQNQKDIQFIENELKSCEAEVRYLSEELMRMRSAYTENHWKLLEERLVLMKSHLRGAEEQLPQIKLLSHDDRQEFDLARAGLDDWLTKLNEADTISRQCRDAFRSLDERLARARQQNDDLWQLFEQTRSLIHSESLPISTLWEQIIEAAYNSHQRLSGWLNAIRFNLDDIENELNRQRDSLTDFNQAVKQMIEEKRDAERQFQYAAQQYQAMHLRAGSRINGRRYSSSYSSLMDDAKSLMAKGLFAEAASRIGGVGTLINQMNHEYNQAIEAERAEERRKQAEHQRKLSRQRQESLQNQAKQERQERQKKQERKERQSSGGASWGGSSSSKNSSGGASWGSSSSSSSKSNKPNKPKPPGGNSSGGANW